jgi:hypothetical protein
VKDLLARLLDAGSLGPNQPGALVGERHLHPAAVPVLTARARGETAPDQPVEHAAGRRRRDARGLGQLANLQRLAHGQRLEQVKLRDAQLGDRGRPVKAAPRRAQRAREVLEPCRESLDLGGGGLLAGGHRVAS